MPAARRRSMAEFLQQQRALEKLATTMMAQGGRAGRRGLS